MSGIAAPRSIARQRRTANTPLRAGLIMLILLVIAMWGAPHLLPFDPLKVDFGLALQPPNAVHWFGTDNLGRDMLSRCLYGAQLSVIIGFCAAGLATVVSVVLGIVTGYIGGRLDLVTQRFVDAWMSFPDLIILIVVVAVVGPGMPQIIVTLGLLLGIGGSRIIRSAVVSVRENMYVHAAQSIGASTGRILLRHILPNVMPPIIVLFTTRVGTVILAESGHRERNAIGILAGPFDVVRRVGWSILLASSDPVEHGKETIESDGGAIGR